MRAVTFDTIPLRAEDGIVYPPCMPFECSSAWFGRKVREVRRLVSWDEFERLVRESWPERTVRTLVRRKGVPADVAKTAPIEAIRACMLDPEARDELALVYFEQTAAPESQPALALEAEDGASYEALEAALADEDYSETHRLLNALGHTCRRIKSEELYALASEVLVEHKRGL